MLDKVSKKIERVMKDLRGATKRKRMRLGTFVNYALAQIGKAAGEEPAVAAWRLRTLKRSVDDVLTRMAKSSFEDMDSEMMNVQVMTAWAPSMSDGDMMEEELTTASDQYASDMSAMSVMGSASFAANLDEVAKALRQLKKTAGKRTPTKKRAHVWPRDLAAR
jgi:hypothetical protein